MYPNANSYRAQAQALTFLFCGAHIMALSANAPHDISYGPQQTLKLNGAITYTDYKPSTLDVVPSVAKTYKASETLPVDNRLAVSVINFYDNLLSNQTSLGREINDIIYDSLWDLYSD